MIQRISDHRMNRPGFHGLWLLSRGLADRAARANEALAGTSRTLSDLTDESATWELLDGGR